ncbi:MAG: HAD family hydrolase [Armatimonadota bacterium]
MNLRHIRAVLLDFDGTVARTEIDFGAMRGDVRRLAESEGVPPELLDGRWVLEMVAAGREHLGDSTPTARRFAAAAAAAILAIELEAADRARLFPGVAEGLVELERRGIKVGIVTRNCRQCVRRVRARHSFACDAILTRDEVPNVKPHRDHLLAALRELGCSADEAVMVGDHVSDIISGRNAGLTTIGVLTSGSDPGELEQAGADLILESAALLPAHIPEL